MASVAWLALPFADVSTTLQVNDTTHELDVPHQRREGAGLRLHRVREAVSEMAGPVDRRQFLGSAAMAIAAHLGVFRAAEASERAPRELAAIAAGSDWINSPRLTAASLAGKVVLVDFWTYTCINWMRTLPYVRAWS